jgi:hypothetical protein
MISKEDISPTKPALKPPIKKLFSLTTVNVAPIHASGLHKWDVDISLTLKKSTFYS